MFRIGRWGLALSSAMLLGFATTPVYAKSIRMLSTGVGIESRIPHKDFPLLVEFSEAKGPLLADVKVAVQDHSGKTIVRTVSEGPWLYLGLAPGDYKVTATRYHGTTHTTEVNVPSTGQKIVRMTW